MRFNDNDIQISVGLFGHWNNVKDQVYHVISKELDPDYIGSVDELRERLSLWKGNESKQIQMVIRSAINPVLKGDGGSCEFVQTVEENGQKGILLKFQGACGSCPSSQQTMKNFIERVFLELMPQFSFVRNVM